MNRKIVVLDFDGVIHSYKSGWQGATIIPDDPVPHVVNAIIEYLQVFDVAVLSSRSSQPGGIEAMRNWFEKHFGTEFKDAVQWPTEKPPAWITIDDRTWPAWDGVFPTVEQIENFKPWHKD